MGIRRGWGGLLDTDPDDLESVAANSLALDPGVVRTIDRTGGTFLHTSRTNPAKVKRTDEPAFLAPGRTDDGPRDHTPTRCASSTGSGSTRWCRSAATTRCRSACGCTRKACR